MLYIPCFICWHLYKDVSRIGEVAPMATAITPRATPQQQAQQAPRGRTAVSTAPQKPRQAQVNARIDAELKEAGDAALAAAGLTPTQAVRMLWSLAVRYQDEPERLHEVLDPDSAALSADEMAERQRRKTAYKTCLLNIEKMYKDLCITRRDPDLDGMSPREYRDLLREEYCLERGYIQ